MCVLRKLIFVIVICAVVSCNKKSSNGVAIGTISTTSILSVSDTLNFIIPDTIPSPFSRSNLFWNSNEHYVGFLGDVNNNEIQIQVLDIEKSKWGNIKLNIEGQNQVYSMGSFGFNGDETITYFASITPRILNVDFDGKVLSNKEFSGKYLHAINNGVFNPNIMQTDSKIGFLSLEFLNMDKPENYEKARLFTIYNFETETVKHIIKHPQEFHDKAWSPNDQGITSIYNEGKIILSFSKSHYLYVYDMQGLLQKQINVKVKGVEEATPLQKNNDAMGSMLKTEATGKYVSFIYDKWRNVYYRIGTFYDTPLFEPKNFEELSAKRNTLTYVIVTLNESLEVIGADYFNYFDTNINNGSYFVNKDGLHMNLRNSENENMISYVRLKLKH